MILQIRDQLYSREFEILKKVSVISKFCEIS